MGYAAGMRIAALTGLACLVLLLPACSGDTKIQIIGGGGTGTVLLSMVPSDPTPAEGSIVSLTVTIMDADSVVSTPFRIRYDPARTEFVDGMVGSFLSSNGGNVSFLTGTDPTNPGVVTVGIAILSPGPTDPVRGAGELCTLRFEILPGAAAGGGLTLQPFNVQVYKPGLELVPSTFGPLTLNPVP